ncbi:MAG TPA: nuclear transport factor 2 family protein [Bosea sp. (in: a-proteobacteria)]|jgi:ketosteroid isomerase-like protein|uniref:YybH family protein n=1 Tax=Bosea sp. (in: a-proteobacteria) TaxID=1871050 RepID=UPI002E12FCA6|nr:nuclear transport factor 2 family protein [Bosea sp. (in: a-proteobacteria)]
MDRSSSRSPLEAFPSAVARLRAALAHVANGDVGPIKAICSHADDATSMYGWGGYEKGWSDISKRWDWAGQQFRGGTVSHSNLTTIVGTELAYTTDIETFNVTLPGMEKPTQWTNRVTHIFRFEEGGWRLLHRHANRLERQAEPVQRVDGDANATSRT